MFYLALLFGRQTRLTARITWTLSTSNQLQNCYNLEASVTLECVDLISLLEIQ